MSLLANQWAIQHHQVTIITLAPASSDAYQVESSVTRVGLHLDVESRSFLQAIGNNVRRILALRRAITSLRPDIVISFVNKLNVLVILSCCGLRIPVIISERSYLPDVLRGRI